MCLAIPSVVIDIFEEDGFVYVEEPVFVIPKWRRSEISGD